MGGDNGPYRTMFGDNWGFYLGTGSNLQKIDTPGRWEDLLFAFARDYQTATIVEEISYTLSFYGEGAKMLRRRITGVRGIGSMILEIRKWDPIMAKWSTYYRGTIDDSTIVVHENYVEASTTPIGVAQDMIAKADEEVTVAMTGKRIVVPRMWPAGTMEVIRTPSTYASDTELILMSRLLQAEFIFDGKDTHKEMRLSFSTGIDGFMVQAQPFWKQSQAVINTLIIAKDGEYFIENKGSYHVELWYSSKAGAQLQKAEGVRYYGYSNGDINEDGILDMTLSHVTVKGKEISYNTSQTLSLKKGDTITIWPTTGGNPNQGFLAFCSTPSDFTQIEESQMRLYYDGGVTVSPIKKMNTPQLSAPAVRDIDLFAQVCRQVINRTDLIFRFSRYAPSYLSTPDSSPAFTYILSLSRLKESEVEDGEAILQGTNEAYFKGLTLNQFYKYFLAQGYKVAVLQVPDSNGVLSPMITVAPYCNTDRKSFYFPPEPNTMVDLGSAVTNIEMARYEHTFVQVVVGSEPQDYGNFPREEGYQDPCNRRITYGIGIETPGDPYEIAMPWGITTFGLEEELLTFEGENDEARAKRWTDGTAMWIVCGEADSKGQIESITQYGPIAGLYYKPLNLGLRPESLMRRNIPLLCMSLAPFDMEDTFYTVENIEGDDINVESAAASTGDEWLHDYNTKDPVRDTDPQGDAQQSGIFRPVMLTLRSTTGENIYALLHKDETRYGVVRFEYRNKEVVGYLRSAEINPTEQAVQKWELLPIWTQDLTIFD